MLPWIQKLPRVQEIHVDDYKGDEAPSFRDILILLAMAEWEDSVNYLDISTRQVRQRKVGQEIMMAAHPGVRTRTLLRNIKHVR
jgi:hypothetical protein